jgi:hypothetical protein
VFVKIIEGVVGMCVLIATASAVPTVDIATTCRKSAKAVVAILGTETAVTYENCMRQELDGRQQLIKTWAKYPTPDRQHCVNTERYMPSYVEWLTCLEMNGDLREMRKSTPKD